MPCFTLVQVEVKDLAAAQAALKKLGLKAKVEKSGSKYVVTPEDQSSGGFRDKFMTEYQVEVATKKARADGYTVSRSLDSETGETVLTLRQY